MFTEIPMLNIILFVLTMLSVLTWSILLVKMRVMAVEKKRSGYFARGLWASGDWHAIAENADVKTRADFTALVQEGLAVLQVINANHQHRYTFDQTLEVIDKALQQTIQQLLRKKESWVSALASIAAISPLIGLFGTVWGIMNALIAISQSGDATLPVVAGPIGEALISTAAGIVVAIPAVLAYNYLLRKLRVHHTQLDNYAEQFRRHIQQHPDFNV